MALRKEITKYDCTQPSAHTVLRANARPLFGFSLGSSPIFFFSNEHNPFLRNALSLFFCVPPFFANIKAVTRKKNAEGCIGEKRN